MMTIPPTKSKIWLKVTLILVRLMGNGGYSDGYDEFKLELSYKSALKWII